MKVFIHKWVFALISTVLCVLVSGCATPTIGRCRPLPRNAVPQVLAVSSFDNRSGFSGEWNLGSDMADLLVSELVSCRNFVVVERKHLDEVVGELERQRKTHFRPEGRVDMGRLKNARYLVRGVISDFSQVGGGSLSITIRSFLFGGKGYTARVALTLTIVDVESGEIVESIQCEGTARARQAYVKADYDNIAFGGDRFFRTPLGIATSNAIRRGVRGIVKKVPHVFWEPMIAAVSQKGIIILNGGSDRGLREGVVYDVRGEGQAVTDPTTGDLLSVIPGTVVGAIRVTQVGAKIAYAEVVKGTGFERGQRLVAVPHTEKK